MISLKWIEPIRSKLFTADRSCKQEQVLTNLMVNAKDAIESHGSGDICVSTRVEADKVLIDVMNTGPTISAKHLSTLFEAFFTTKPQGKGTGLGLAICKRLVSTNQGEITAESKNGTTWFTLSFPAVQVT